MYSYIGNRQGLSGQLKVAFPDGRPVLTFDRISAELGAALQSGGYYVRPDGTPYTMSKIAGGDLLDGCPANVITSDGVYTPAQLDAIAKDHALQAAVATCRYSWKPQAPPSPTDSLTTGPMRVTVMIPPQGPVYAPSSGSGGGYQAGPNTPGPPDTSAQVAPVTTSTGLVTPQLYSPAEANQTGQVAGPAIVSEAGVSSGLPMILLAGAALYFLTRKRR
jgi:hypothetical protein